MSDRNRRQTEARAVAAPFSPMLLPAVLLTIGDVVLTLAWLQRGIAVEANPLVKGLIDLLGAPFALGLRGVVGVALLVALAVLSRHSRLAKLALPAVTVVLAGVFVWHIVGGLSVLLL